MLSEQLPLREVSLARLRWRDSHLRKVGIQEFALDPAGLAGASQSDLVPSFTIVFDVLRYAKTIVSSRAAAATFRGLNKCNLLAYKRSLHYICTRSPEKIMKAIIFLLMNQTKVDKRNDLH